MEFLGRRDDQVKLHGFRIELGEIESTLRACVGVDDAACAVRSERLVAYVVGRAEEARLREHAATHLPEHMVPATYLPLDALPLSPAGKVDRRALPEPLRAAPSAPGPASTETERALQKIWAEVLEVEAVGVRDDFFALGGHSLLATRLAARIRAQLGAEIPLRRFFSAPTIEELAPLVEAADLDANRPTPIQAGARPATIPLSFAQERLWFLDRLEEDSSAYHMPGAVRLGGPLDVSASSAPSQKSCVATRFCAPSCTSRGARRNRSFLNRKPTGLSESTSPNTTTPKSPGADSPMKRPP